jgi:hypothetical protein
MWRRVALVKTDRSELQLRVTANVITSLPIISTLKMEAMYSSETSVLTKFTRRYIAEDDVL